ncbi:MAG: sialidase family protein [Anaerolineae bacterium]
MFARSKNKPLVWVAITIIGFSLMFAGRTYAATLGSLIRISPAESPVPITCPISKSGELAIIFTAGGTNYRNSETETHLSVNPADPNNMIAAYHQDRWSTGAASEIGISYTFDGGATWKQTVVPLSDCLGGRFDRISDPWVDHASDGTAYLHVLWTGRDGENSQGGMLVTRSVNGGKTWSEPIIQVDFNYPAVQSGNFVALNGSKLHDKNTLTVDPNDDNFIYAVWDRVGIFDKGAAPTVFTRSTDGGQSWEPVRNIYNVNQDNPYDATGKVSQTIANQIVGLPQGEGGKLLNVMNRLFLDKDGNLISDYAAIFSEDKGQTWSNKAVVIHRLPDNTPAFHITDNNPNDSQATGVPLRVSGFIHDVAVNRSNGYLYIVYPENKASGDEILLQTSRDGGLTWSQPVRINTVHAGPNQDAFLPMVAVADNGKVGVLYYDFRNDVLNDAPLSADAFLAVFEETVSDTGGSTGIGLDFKEEVGLTDNSFDMRKAPIAVGYFLGEGDGHHILCRFCHDDHGSCPAPLIR